MPDVTLRGIEIDRRQKEHVENTRVSVLTPYKREGS